MDRHKHTLAILWAAVLLVVTLFVLTLWGDNLVSEEEEDKILDAIDAGISDLRQLDPRIQRTFDSIGREEMKRILRQCLQSTMAKRYERTSADLANDPTDAMERHSRGILAVWGLYGAFDRAVDEYFDGKELVHE